MGWYGEREIRGVVMVFVFFLSVMWYGVEF